MILIIIFLLPSSNLQCKIQCLSIYFTSTARPVLWMAYIMKRMRYICKTHMYHAFSIYACTWLCDTVADFLVLLHTHVANHPYTL